MESETQVDPCPCHQLVKDIGLHQGGLVDYRPWEIGGDQGALRENGCRWWEIVLHRELQDKAEGHVYWTAITQVQVSGKLVATSESLKPYLQASSWVQSLQVPHAKAQTYHVTSVLVDAGEAFPAGSMPFAREERMRELRKVELVWRLAELG